MAGIPGCPSRSRWLRTRQRNPTRIHKANIEVRPKPPSRELGSRPSGRLWRLRHNTELERYMRCKDCSEVRGYSYKRSHLVALRPTKISANDPPSRWWPGEG